MMRTLLGIFLGLLLAFALMFGMEMLGFALFPLPAGTTLANEVDLARLVAESSIGKKLWVVLGWALASFAGAWLAARVSRQHPRFAALAVGALIVAGTVMNAMTIPHPMWMNLLGVLLPLPLAWLAARLARGGHAPATPRA